MFKSKSSEAFRTVPRLERLFNSLISIICAYTNKPEGSNVFKMQTVDELRDNILSMLTWRWLTDRTNLMLYILSIIQLIQLHIENPKALNEAETTNLKNKLIDFISNLQKIINASNSIKIGVLMNGRNITIEGCGTWHSVSGDLIRNKLFKEFSLPIQGSEHLIRQFITDSLNEQQNPLLLRKIELLASINESKNQEYLSIRNRLIDAEEQVERLKPCVIPPARSYTIFTSLKEETEETATVLKKYEPRA